MPIDFKSDTSTPVWIIGAVVSAQSENWAMKQCIQTNNPSLLMDCGCLCWGKNLQVPGFPSSLETSANPWLLIRPGMRVLLHFPKSVDRNITVSELDSGYESFTISIEMPSRWGPGISQGQWVLLVKTASFADLSFFSLGGSYHQEKLQPESVPTTLYSRELFPEVPAPAPSLGAINWAAELSPIGQCKFMSDDLKQEEKGVMPYRSSLWREHSVSRCSRGSHSAQTSPSVSSSRYEPCTLSVLLSQILESPI